MSVYYQDEHVTLYHGEALDVLPDLTTGTVDSVITDPPYILHAASAHTRGGKVGGWADLMNASTWYAAWYRLAAQALRGDGSLWTMGNWRSIPVMMRAALDAGLAVSSMLVWDKAWIGPGGPQGLRSQHEICLVMPMPGWVQPDRAAGDVQRVKASSRKPSGHPAEKPVPLMARLIGLAATPAGGLILDPFAGSCTTGVAAKALGARAVLIEAEERWCEVGASRLSQGCLDREAS